jgi:hypothetical protein
MGYTSGERRVQLEHRPEDIRLLDSLVQPDILQIEKRKTPGFSLLGHINIAGLHVPMEDLL